MVAPGQHGGTAPPLREAELEGNDDPNAKGPNGETALATACSDGDAAGVGSLLAAGADAAAEGWSAWEGVLPLNLPVQCSSTGTCTAQLPYTSYVGSGKWQYRIDK